MDSPRNKTGQLPQARDDDIKELFRKFDGEAEKYQEIGRDSRAVVAEAHWPILSRLNIEQVTSALPVQRVKPAFGSPAPPTLQAAQAPFAPQSAPNHALLFKRTAPIVVAEADQDRSLSAIFKRLIGAAPAPAAPKRSMLFNRNKT
jgi:hypothetical protein